ncbi:MAG TPA: hypothetical protein VHW67_12745 [Solirubrobacteraceae bacterium]|jgi:hypothetical protein|nr:hypothetical protein [Solirubrobacteraceae bacterium]
MTGRIPVRAAKLAVSLVTVGAVFAVMAMAASASTVVYNNLPKPLPGNVQSIGFQAESAAELGGQIEATGPVTNPMVTVGMSSWACQSGGATDDTCASAAGSTFTVPITLNIYAVGPENSVGAKLVTLTQGFAVPYRPSADPRCAGNGGWFKKGECFHGKLFKIKFGKLGTKKAPVTLPAKTIVSVAFNTFSHGYAPTGVQGPYDSLNVALTEPLKEGEEVPPTVGADPVPADAYFNSTSGGFYCDGGTSGTGTFRLDAGCWTGAQPLIEVKSAG